jgi:hypothetical protein
MTKKFTFVSHDSFARQSIYRQTVKTDATCKWCGSNPKGRLFQYFVFNDDRAVMSQPSNEIRGLFCSKDCMETYHS